jgi:hypothetical protein
MQSMKMNSYKLYNGGERHEVSGNRFFEVSITSVSTNVGTDGGS